MGEEQFLEARNENITYRNETNETKTIAKAKARGLNELRMIFHEKRWWIRQFDYSEQKYAFIWTFYKFWIFFIEWETKAFTFLVDLKSKKKQNQANTRGFPLENLERLELLFKSILWIHLNQIVIWFCSIKSCNFKA